MNIQEQYRVAMIAALQVQIISLEARLTISVSFIMNQALIVESEMLSQQIVALKKELARYES